MSIEENVSKEPGYPTWRYNKEKCPEGLVVHSSAEEKALGEGWVDTPAKFSEDSKNCKGEAETYQEHQENWAAKDEKNSGDLEAKSKKTKKNKAD